MKGCSVVSRCYTCGAGLPGKHMTGCPDYMFEKAIGMPARIIPTSKKVEVEYVTKLKKSFLPLELSQGNTIPSSSISIIGGQPQIPCKPYRLWIDETISPLFVIHSIFIGVKPQFVSPGKIPANIFRTGRWPLPENQDKDLEFGIDLSTWDTIEVGQWFRIQVENISCNAMPIRCALEVTCLV